MRKLRIGTRGSDLALWQARFVANELRRTSPHLEVELQIIRTTGDEGGPPAPPPEGIGVFTKEIESALREGRIDLAVHSLKDLPTTLTPGLALEAIMTREDPADALITKGACSLEDLLAGARVLTGSPRRKAQALHRRPDLVCQPVRGNVPTRLRKLDEQGADALILACAGLSRLGLAGRIAQRLDPAEFVPACGQGALAVESRADDPAVGALCKGLDDEGTRLATTAERAFLARVEGGCKAPAGAYGRFVGGTREMILTGMVATLDGSRLLKQTVRAAMQDAGHAEELGRRLAEGLLAAGGDRILSEVAAQGVQP